MRYATPLATAAAIVTAAITSALLPHDAAPASRVDLGRRVYIAEGCIHCHSQYVRPVGHDIGLWGPPTPPQRALAHTPVLIGNRRQGPDLANVGLRRPPAWNRLHLIDPRSLVPGSRMPSYSYLFAPGDPRGPALLAYLAQLEPPPVASPVQPK